MDKKDATLSFSPEKKFKLILERSISFEEVIAAIDNGQLLDVVEHANQQKYSGQKVYGVNISDYVYLVPFVEDNEGNIFLKTIIPSRKAKHRYIGEGMYETSDYKIKA